MYMHTEIFVCFKACVVNHTYIVTLHSEHTCKEWRPSHPRFWHKVEWISGVGCGYSLPAELQISCLMSKVSTMCACATCMQDTLSSSKSVLALPTWQ